MRLKKIRVAEEGSTQAGVAMDPAQATPHAPAQGVEIVGGRVDQGGDVRMGRELFDRIQFRGISRERFQVQPVPMALQGLAGDLARRAGRWRLQPNCRSTRHVCESE